MDIDVEENRPTESGRKIVAVASDRVIEIELDRLTSQTTRMRELSGQIDWLGWRRRCS